MLKKLVYADKLLETSLFFSILLIGSRLYNAWIDFNISGFPLFILRGILSDVAVASLIAIILSLRFMPRVVMFIGTIVFIIIITANNKHIAVNSANIDLFLYRHALQKNFILGSGLPIVFNGILLSIPLLIIRYFLMPDIVSSIIEKIANIQYLIIAHIALCLMPVIIPPSSLHITWAQLNPIEDHLRITLSTSKTADDVKIEVPITDPDQFDLNALPRLKLGNTNTNILLLVTEGLSYQDITPEKTPFLYVLSKQTMLYNHFINHQRITNNGMYSLWCGDYPNLLDLSTKVDHHLQSSTAQTTYPCLGSVLKSHGYENYFLQSSDSEYMNFERISVYAGIENEWGGSKLPVISAESGWGSSDPDLFSSLTHILRKAKNHSSPFFITTLNIITHHPYDGIKDEILSNFDNKRDAALFVYDQMLASFFTQALNENLLKNTLVLLTSDESGLPVKLNLGYPKGMIGANHGVVMVITPQKDADVISELFSQHDIMVSILDYLGLAIPPNTKGRSLFRSYDSFRKIGFSNTFLRHVFLLEAPNTLISCPYQLNRCVKSQFEGALFADKTTFNTQDAHESDIHSLIEFAAIRDIRYDIFKPLWSQSKLFLKGSTKILDKKRLRAGQGTIMVWNVDATAPETNKEPIIIKLYLDDFHGYLTIPLSETSFTINPGESISEVMQHSFWSDTQFQVHMIVQATNDDELHLDNTSINLEVHK